MTVTSEIHQSVPDDLVGPREVATVTTTYLEMRARPSAPLAPPPPAVEIVRAVKPTVRFYRYLYDSVGLPWHWYDRRRMPAPELAAILADDRVEVHVLYREGVPAGYTELDRRGPRVTGPGGAAGTAAPAAEVELAYFGLVPEAIGHKLGPWLLAWSIHEAWRPADVARVWVHTCTLDHPAALRTYLAAGFTKYGEAVHRQTILAPSR
jgi:GNAT superfamily N-acetyltransferase